ncbi:unnamed protein product, partial [Ectocarpus sp. 4 AP-2014]
CQGSSCCCVFFCPLECIHSWAITKSWSEEEQRAATATSSNGHHQQHGLKRQRRHHQQLDAARSCAWPRPSRNGRRRQKQRQLDRLRVRPFLATKISPASCGGRART